jgi:hypothetical protein
VTKAATARKYARKLLETSSKSENANNGLLTTEKPGSARGRKFLNGGGKG